MKRLVSLILAVLALAALMPARAARVVRSTQALNVDGRTVYCEYYNIDDRNYFKLRDLAYLLNGTESRFSVDYDAEKNAVLIVRGQDYAPIGSELGIGEDMSSTAQITGQTIYVDGEKNERLTVYNIGGIKGYNYFQLRELGKVLGFGVDYDEENRTILVKSGVQPAPDPVRLQPTEDAGREYLDKIVFLGDSTTYGIGYYWRHGYKELCPPAQVWTPSSGTLTLSYYGTSKIVYPPTGEELLIADAVKKGKPEIMMITLGINGIAFMDEEWFKRDYTALVKSIQEASPDTQIILNSLYPVADAWPGGGINNDSIRRANGWVEQIAEDTGVHFLYSYESVAVNGKLPDSAHNGDGLHLTGETFTKVMDYIRTHALPSY